MPEMARKRSQSRRLPPWLPTCGHKQNRSQASCMRKARRCKQGTRTGNVVGNSAAAKRSGHPENRESPDLCVFGGFPHNAPISCVLHKVWVHLMTSHIFNGQQILTVWLRVVGVCHLLQQLPSIGLFLQMINRRITRKYAHFNLGFVNVRIDGSVTSSGEHAFEDKEKQIRSALFEENSILDRRSFVIYYRSDFSLYICLGQHYINLFQLLKILQNMETYI